MEIRDFFDSAYSTPERYWWRQPNIYSLSPEDHAGSLMTQFILRHARHHGPGRALDVGSGEGADAIRLARLGWEVDAVELSGNGVRKIQKFAREAEVQLRIERGDLLTHPFRHGRYDMVICNGVLHYIQDKETACRRLQELTRPGGINAISLWSDYTPVPDCHRVVPTFPDRERGTVYQAYATWSKPLLYFERMRVEQGHHDMPGHLHSFIKMIAQNVYRPPEPRKSS
ncbi:class I SAM-dependent methyltransferase [Plantactinospora siamensis]|uniref:Class I SAM-dependent methyltransferase n=1 Tax=Plantactinospora siamensis TaxID=555372 RepID=A0ABV6P094_9ACTN